MIRLCELTPENGNRMGRIDVRHPSSLSIVVILVLAMSVYILMHLPDHLVDGPQ